MGKKLFLIFIIIVGMISAGCAAKEAVQTTTAAPTAISPPKEFPPGELGKMVKLGKELVEQTNTQPLTKQYVGNALRCSSCHLNAGTDPKAGTFIGTASAYPAYSSREKAVITLEDRIQNCFMRSDNGIRPPDGSKPVVAIAAYITWLSQNNRMKMNPEKPLGPYGVPKLKVDLSKVDTGRGKQVYENKCANCHGMDGRGVAQYPPVWGPESYNAGAGLAKPNLVPLASWLKVAMPLGNPDLSEQEAIDVAAYVDSQPRPNFVLKEHLPSPDKMGVYNSNVPEEVVIAPTWPPRH